MTLPQTHTPKVTTCAECPFARHIDGDRYCCTEAATAQDTVRGYWEPRTDCLAMLEQIAVKPIAPTEETPAATVPAVPAVTTATPAVTTATPAAVKPSARSKLMPAIVAVKRIYSDISASNFDRAELEIAADTILMLGGFINPPVVRRDGTNYQVVAGHFQYHAAALAQRLNPIAGENIPALIVEPENEAAMLAQIQMMSRHR